MDNFLRYLITPLLSNPADLTISLSGSTATIKVSEADNGRVIGKKGVVINAIRTLVKTYCSLHKIPTINVVLQASPKK